MPQKPPLYRPFGWQPAPKNPNPHHAFYGTQAWKKLREYVRQRDNGVCQKCGDPGWRVDHIKPRADGGSDDPSNLQTLCNDCDAKKHREKGTWRR